MLQFVIELLPQLDIIISIRLDGGAEHSSRAEGQLREIAEGKAVLPCSGSTLLSKVKLQLFIMSWSYSWRIVSGMKSLLRVIMAIYCKM